MNVYHNIPAVYGPKFRGLSKDDFSRWFGKIEEIIHGKPIQPMPIIPADYRSTLRNGYAQWESDRGYAIMNWDLNKSAMSITTSWSRALIRWSK